MPVILQTEAAECGAGLPGDGGGAHGQHTDLPTLRQRFSLSLKGATMADLVRMAGALQLQRARAARRAGAAARSCRCRAILHWDLNHFVVLTEGAGATAR